MNIIAVTCVRMNSTRFPGKCLYPLAGKPLLQWTIDFAKSINEWIEFPLYTFTRDQQIIDYVKDKTPIIYEPEELFDTPYNSTYEKMQYVNRILDADYVVLLQPTQPIRDADKIFSSIKFITNSSWEYAYTVNEDEKEDGCFYIYSRKYLINKINRYLCLKNDKSFDINTIEDLKECEEWLQRQK